MKFTLVLLAVCSTTLALPQAGPPVIPGYNDPNVQLSKACELPRCPLTREAVYKPVTLPYPPDCLQYILCESGIGRVVACPGDLVYNKNTGECDTRENAVCSPCWQQAV